MFTHKMPLPLSNLKMDRMRPNGDSEIRLLSNQKSRWKCFIIFLFSDFFEASPLFEKSRLCSRVILFACLEL